MTSIYQGQRVLITGGTGSLGKTLVETILRGTQGDVELIIYSRDEAKQASLRAKFPQENIHCVIGDVRDRKHLNHHCRGADIILHTGALKRVDDGEYNVSEFIKTNLLGSENVIHAAFKNNVTGALLVSTDKAVLPINAYGAAKMLAEKAFIDADYQSHKINGPCFAIVRYGNIIASRGSVIPLFVDWARKGEPLKITRKDMTRFFMTLYDACNLIEASLNHSQGGDVTVAKMSSVNMLEMAKAIIAHLKSTSDIEEIGIRPGEKVHESLVADNAFVNVYDTGDYYIVGSPLVKREYEHPLAELKHYTSSNYVEYDPAWIIAKIQSGGIEL